MNRKTLLVPVVLVAVLVGFVMWRSREPEKTVGIPAAASSDDSLNRVIGANTLLRKLIVGEETVEGEQAPAGDRVERKHRRSGLSFVR